MNVFRNYFIDRQYVTDDIKTLTSFIKYDLQNSIETNIYCKKSKETLFWFNGDGLNNCSLIILRKKQTTKSNTTSKNITYLVDNKTICVNIKECTHSQLKEENGF